jgi:D-alanyl-D-alanine dipeptidase
MLIQITPEEYDVELALTYATPNNFMNKVMYKLPVCFLHHDAILPLKKAIELAGALGFKLKIFDAFRPQEVQEKFWAFKPDPTFLADPKIGSNHSRGVAIDLTLIDQNGIELEMGTEFDGFTPLSHHGCTKISIEAQKNRFILLGIMRTAGWDLLPTEWWHYQLPTAKNYPVFSYKATGMEMI